MDELFKNYIFDLYGTLIDIRTDEEKIELWEKMAIFYGYRKANYSAFELRQTYHAMCGALKLETQKKHPDYQKVDFDLTRVFRKLYEAKGVKVSDELASMTANVFRCYSTDFIKLYDGVEDLLKTLKSKGKNIYLLSNAQHDFTLPEIDMLGLREYFDDILISSDFECSKPDTHYFEILFERNSLKKEDSIMIGNDCVSDIKSAHNFGIKSLYIHQEISPPITVKLESSWNVMDGNVKKIKKMIVR